MSPAWRQAEDSSSLPEDEELNPQIAAEHEAILLRPGDIVAGRFEVISLIGRGGMGAVYRVADRRLGGQKALKIMLPSLLRSERARQRFLTEISVSQQLRHESIVTVYDLLEDHELGVQFFTMEFVEGRTLQNLLEERGGRLPVKVALDITRQLCDALTYAHQYTIHRDLKPQNIVVCSDGRIKILDFGLAKAVTPGRLTSAGIALGTAYYQAPELSTRAGEVDQRADIYTLGVILYRMLTGEVPVGRFSLPSRVAPGVPRHIDFVVLRCLEPNASDRYSTAADVRKALGNARSRLGRIAVFATVCVLLAVGAFAGGYFFYSNALFRSGDTPPHVQPVADVAASGAEGARAEALQAQLDAKAAAAETLSKDLYAKGLSALDQGRAYESGARYGLAANSYQDAARSFRESSEDAKQAAARLVSGAREIALSARAAARVELVQKYAASELGSADVLWQKAENSQTNYEEAVPLYDEAAAIYGTLANIAEQRRDAARNSATEARTSALESQAKLPASNRNAAAAEITAGEEALAAGAEKGDDYGAALQQYQLAKAKFEEAAAKITAAKAEAQRPVKEPPKEQQPASGALAVTGALSLTPSRITLSAAKPEAQIKVLLGGSSAAPSSVKSAKIEGQYGWMFDVVPSKSGPASVTVRAKQAEDGEYRLAINSGGQTAYADVLVTTASEAPGSLPFRLPPRLRLDDSYEEGTLLTYEVDAPAGSGLTFVWSINGREVLRGQGQTKLVATLSSVGDCEIQLTIEKDGKLHARSSGTTRVTPVRPLSFQVWAGHEFAIDNGLPHGYGDYRWEVDGVTVSRDRVLKHTFGATGRHRIDGYASSPTQASQSRSTVHIAYDTEVRQF